MSFKFQVDFQLRISFPNTAQDECGVGVSGSSQAKPLKASFCRVVTQAGMCWISRWKNSLAVRWWRRRYNINTGKRNRPIPRKPWPWITCSRDSHDHSDCHPLWHWYCQVFKLSLISTSRAGVATRLPFYVEVMVAREKKGGNEKIPFGNSCLRDVSRFLVPAGEPKHKIVPRQLRFITLCIMSSKTARVW